MNKSYKYLKVAMIDDDIISYYLENNILKQADIKEIQFYNTFNIECNISYFVHCDGTKFTNLKNEINEYIKYLNDKPNNLLLYDEINKRLIYE